MQRVVRTACAALLFLGLAACNASDSDSGSSGSGHKSSGDAGDQQANKLSVPVVKKDRDTSYRVGPTATVKNDGYSDGKRGTVTVQASTSTKHPDDNKHWLAARVVLKGGRSVRCEEFRATIWNDFGPFEPVSMPCVSEIPLTDAVRVEVVPFA